MGEHRQMKWFRTTDEKLADAQSRTGIQARIEYDRSRMEWRGRLDGMSGYVCGVTEYAVKRGLLSLLRSAPTVK